ncbi:hypothetical protein M413DRAFT_387059 [Hebeloma cylindrosporum]|uniref:Uncharacterized protein n=1 Tax=Hebeloma cylindrosporum TaxID=76867 RepID=A0A0C2Y1I5_HEBCY|nr:hypothetical protein M413DRAFT_387059 [Hebeloma cylindrosporum h7]
MLPRSPTLDGPIDLYTTQELEDLVVSRISAEAAWRSRKDPKYREIALPDGFGEADSVLVDGGRWLLVLSELQVHHGCVLAYDLDDAGASIYYPTAGRMGHTTGFLYGRGRG